MEEICLPEDGPIELGADISVVDAERAEQEARRAEFQPWLACWADGSRDENGAVNGRSGRKEVSHGLLSGDLRRGACALAEVVERTKRRKLGSVRIFTDAQAAIKRVTHDEPGVGQTYALQARKSIEALRKQNPPSKFEIRWCPPHKPW